MSRFTVNRFSAWEDLGDVTSIGQRHAVGHPGPAWAMTPVPTHGWVFLKPHVEPLLMRVLIHPGGKGELVEATDAFGRNWTPAHGDVHVATEGPGGRGHYFAAWTLGGHLEATRDFVSRIVWGRTTVQDLERLPMGHDFSTVVSMEDFTRHRMRTHYLEAPLMA